MISFTGPMVAIATMFLWPMNCAHSTQFYDGHKLYSLCSREYSPEFPICVGYVVGVIDILSKYQLLEPTNEGHWPGDWVIPHPMPCFTSGLSGYQAVDIVMQYLKENIKATDQGASHLIYLSMMDAFPCTSQQ
jgi:hypothetical protein